MSRSSASNHETSAVVAKRGSVAPVETAEIRSLATAAGYDVVAELTQVGPEDPGTHFGSGKADELAAVVADTDARTVVVDGELTPSQHHSLRERLPGGTELLDRYRVVLEIFDRGAGSGRARLQVELARLRYDLPRLIEGADEGMLNERTEKGSPVYDVRDRIDALERKLAESPDPAEHFRERRRDQGFDLVTIAGYTNAGKSTLLRRLADDMSLDERGRGDRSEKDATASVRDRLFETLETTTRRTTIDGRPVLATDTVGFVSDLPHRLVASFSETLSEATAADAVVLVVDASDPVGAFREKLDVSMDVLAEQGVDSGAVVTALNKVDTLDEDERERRRAVASDLAPEPIPMSVLDGTNLDRLRERIRDRLPTDRAVLVVPNCDEAMTLVSEAYDRTAVDDVTYRGDEVRIELDGRPSVVERLRARAAAVGDGARPQGK